MCPKNSFKDAWYWKTKRTNIPSSKRSCQMAPMPISRRLASEAAGPFHKSISDESISSRALKMQCLCLGRSVVFQVSPPPPNKKKRTTRSIPKTASNPSEPTPPAHPEASEAHPLEPIGAHPMRHVPPGTFRNRLESYGVTPPPLPAE